MTSAIDHISEQAALDKLDGSGSDKEREAVERLRLVAGDRLPALLLEKYRSSAKAPVRASAVYYATRYAQGNDDAIKLGLEALGDRSKTVRYRACLLLAYSQSPAALPVLRSVFETVPAESRGDITAAIDAIENRNHHYFVDREHSGKVKLNVLGAG